MFLWDDVYTWKEVSGSFCVGKTYLSTSYIWLFKFLYYYRDLQVFKGLDQLLVLQVLSEYWAFPLEVSFYNLIDPLGYYWKE